MTKKPTKKRVRWRCRICKTTYDDKSDAIACTRLPLEPKQFMIGANVRSKGMLTCTGGGRYEVRGRVVKIIGPLPPDEEYVKKWLLTRGHVSGRHIFRYEVKFSCPHCKKTKKVHFCAVEIARIR